MPALERVIETAIYVDDLVRAAAFYEQVMDLPGHGVRRPLPRL